MQDIKTIKASGQTPAIILNKDLEFDLLVRETRLENLRKDREDRDIFNQGEIALDSAAYNGDSSDTVHTNGHVIQTNRARNNRYQIDQKEKDPHGLKTLERLLMEAGVNMAILNTWIQNIGATLSPATRASSNLKGTFDDKAQNDFQVVMDENFIYGGENVSSKTADLIQKRIDRIIRMQKEIEETSDPVQRAALQERFENLVERSGKNGIVYHPQVGWSFSSDYVEELDDAITQRYGACEDGVVCTFSLRSLGSHNGRKMKIDVADQYDQDPTETVGKVEVQTPQVVAPPSMHYVR